MTRPTANPDLATSHYTRVSGTSEAGRKATPVLGRMHQPSLKEATMLRICTTVALIALTSGLRLLALTRLGLLRALLPAGELGATAE